MFDEFTHWGFYHTCVLVMTLSGVVFAASNILLEQKLDHRIGVAVKRIVATFWCGLTDLERSNVEAQVKTIIHTELKGDQR